MPAPTASQKAAAAVGFLAVVGAVAVGALVPTHPDNPGALHSHHAQVAWGDGGAPAGARCYTVQARGSRAALDLFGVTSSDGGAAYEYVQVTVAYIPDDAGSGPSLPAGMDPIDDTATDAPCAANAPRLDAVTQGPGSTMPCACSTGPTCLQPDGGPAPSGLTLQPGAFTPSAACLPKVCVEWAGFSSWPAECPQQ